MRRHMVPCEVLRQKVSADFHGPQDVVPDLDQEFTVFRKRLRVGVAAFVCTELQQNCEDEKRKENAIGEEAGTDNFHNELFLHGKTESERSDCCC